MSIRCRLARIVTTGMLASLALGCQLSPPASNQLDHNDRFDDANFGEYGQSMRQSEENGNKLGASGKSRQIESNLGF